MGKEILYRRSFHCDRDLKSVKNMLELERVVESRKANGDGRMLADGGFEAPRNSLDVPIGGSFMERRHSEVRCEDIPIGYELSRSLTSRRRNEDPLVRKSVSSADSFLLKPKFSDKSNPEADQRPRASSVVARLMGLDPLPPQDDVQGLQSSSHPSSRRLLPHEFFMPQSGPCASDKQAGISRVPSQRGTHFIEESISEKPRNYGELPFRNHPQEKQLQEFKKEFAVHQHKQSEPCPKVDMLQKEQKGSGRETLQESQEFLDALDFLKSNKEFFVKVLKDPSALFTKNFELRGGVSSVHKESAGQKGRRLTRSFSESRKESYICLPVVQDLTDARRKHEMNQDELGDKVQNVCMSHFGQDEHMPPLQSRTHTHSVSPPLRTGYDQTLPTKIVVLKPKVARHSGNRSCSPLSPLSPMDASLKAKVDGKESMRHDIRERSPGRNERAATKELSRNFSKDGLKEGSKDAGDIARRIIKQVKEDMSRRLSSENCESLESVSLARSSSRGRRSQATEKPGIFVDAAGASDGEGYCSSSRRIVRDNVKAHVSLPSSPRLSRIDSENECRPFAGNGRKGVSGEKSSRVSAAGNTSRDARKDYMGAGGSADGGKKQDGMRDAKSLTNTRTGSGKDSKGTNQSPKVLSRSLSTPASAATIENKAWNCEQKGTSPVNRPTCLDNARTSEASLFKGRLMNFKDSLSMNKKSSRKQTGSSISEISELSGPRQLQPTEEHECITGVDAKEACTSSSLPAYPWQMTCSRQDNKEKAVMDGCLDYLMSVNSVESSGQQQWTSTGDLLDSSSDVSLEKCEQPSPISVLDTPFQEESSSPEQTSPECHDASLKYSPLDADYKKRLLDLQEALLSLPASWQSSFNSIAEEALPEGSGADLPFETLRMGDITCPPGKEEELIYIRDLLAFAGFTNTEVATGAHAFSAKHGLDPSIFAGLESHYEKISKSNASSRCSRYSTPLNALSRKMLYDVIDEILSSKLNEPTFQLGLWQQAKPFVRYRYTGKQLLEQLWAQISDYHYVPCDSEEDGLDNLASKELLKDAGWAHSASDIQALTRELERFICGDLIRELVHEYVRV